MERLRIPFAALALLTLTVVIAGCGNSDPDPSTVLDRALTRANLAGLGQSGSETAGGTVSVQALGYGDRILDQREVNASPEVMAEIRNGLGSESGLRGLVGDLAYEGEEQIAGVGTDHITGSLDVAGLSEALEEAGGGEVGSLAGVGRDVALEDSLDSADFDLYAGEEDGTIRRLDLTLAFDDPDNALPPTRIRFSLTPDTSGGTLQ